MSVHRGDAYLADLPHGGKWTETQTNAEWLIHLQRGTAASFWDPTKSLQVFITVGQFNLQTQRSTVIYEEMVESRGREKSIRLHGVSRH